METTFKYNGTIITTPNLEKKLKRMKISINDIEIIDNPIKKIEDTGLDEFHKTHIPYLEPIENGYAVHYLKIEQDYPSHWIPAKIVNKRIVI